MNKSEKSEKDPQQSPEVQNLVNLLQLQGETIQAYKTINYAIKKIDEFEKKLEEITKRIENLLNSK